MSLTHVALARQKPSDTEDWTKTTNLKRNDFYREKNEETKLQIPKFPNNQHGNKVGVNRLSSYRT